MKKEYVISILVLFLLFLVGCEQQTAKQYMEGEMTDENMEQQGKDMMEEIIIEDKQTQEGNAPTAPADWKQTHLKDIKTGSTFKISDFKGKPILLQSFAVWCPKCKKQQDELVDFTEQVGDSVVSISLDTDPNEDEEKVLQHINRHGYDWLYAVSPTDLTKSLIDEFGVGVVNAPQGPMVLICEDQSTRLLPRGNKDPETLKSEIEKGC